MAPLMHSQARPDVVRPTQKRDRLPSVHRQTARLHERIAHLQRSLGNQNLLRLVQPKLDVGQPQDVFEREADHIAGGIVDGTGRCSGTAKGGTDSSVDRPADGQPAAQALLSGLGSGRRLDTSTRRLLEPGLGASLDAIRVHTGAQATLGARLLGARAFTIGSHVVVDDTQYRPSTREGRRLLAHELVHARQQGAISSHDHRSGRRSHSGPARVPAIQLAPIPATATLNDFVGWTQRAIDDLRPGAPATLGNEALTILRGLRNHVGLQNRSGQTVQQGGSFSLAAGGLFAGLSRAVPFRLVVDDRANPPLSGSFTRANQTITVFANRFRGQDHQTLGGTLFHEAVHALFNLRRQQPGWRPRSQAARILNLGRHRATTAHLRMLLGLMLPGDPRIAGLADRLTEEVVVRVEYEAHDASVSRTASGRLTAGSFNAAMLRYLFHGGHMLTPADRQAIQANPARNQALNDLIARLRVYFLHLLGVRLRQVGVSPTGIRITGGRPRSIYRPPPLRPPSFIPNIIRSVEKKPF